MTVTAKFVSGARGLPLGANKAGYEANQTPLFVARAVIDGGLHIGKFRQDWAQASIPYGGQERWVSSFEVWVGRLSNNASGAWDVPSIGTPVACGNEADGTPLYAARAEYQGGLHIGKWRKDWTSAAISFGGVEVWVPHFQVLTSFQIID